MPTEAWHQYSAHWFPLSRQYDEPYRYNNGDNISSRMQDGKWSFLCERQQRLSGPITHLVQKQLHNCLPVTQLNRNTFHIEQQRQLLGR